MRQRQVVEIVPLRDALGVDGLNGAPVPDDIQIVKALVIDVIALRIDRRTTLGVDEITFDEFDPETQIGLGTLFQKAPGLDLGRQDAQRLGHAAAAFASSTPMNAAKERRIRSGDRPP